MNQAIVHGPRIARAPLPHRGSTMGSDAHDTEPDSRPSRWRRMLAMPPMLAGFALCAWSGFEPGVVLVIGVLLIIAGLAVQARLAARRPGARASDRRYAREFFFAMSGYIVIVALVWPQVTHVHAVWLKVVFALLPAVPTLFVARAMVRRIRDADELERRVQLEAGAIAGMVVGLITFCLGFMQFSGVLPAVRGELFMVYPLLFAVWGLAYAWTQRRYR